MTRETLHQLKKEHKRLSRLLRAAQSYERLHGYMTPKHQSNALEAKERIPAIEERLRSAWEGV